MRISQVLRTLLIACCSIFMLSFVASSGGPTIKVKKGKITIEKIVVNSDWGLANFKKALGEPDRAGGTYNKVHVYDKKCISVFEAYNNSVPSGVVKEIKIYYKVTEEGEFVPTGSGFNGTITVDKLKLTKDLTSADMKKKLSKWKETDSFLDHCYRMTSHGLYIYFQFNESENELQKVSIGPDKRSTSK